MKYGFSVAAATLALCSVLIAPQVRAEKNELFKGSPLDGPADGRGNRASHVPGRAVSGGAVATGNGISYHNGPVMTGTVNIYYIWYGNWDQDPQANTILTDWANSIGGSPYMGVNATYGDTIGNVSGAVAYGGSTTDAGSFGTALTDSNIGSIVSSALSSRRLPTDSNGVYFVLTAPGVAETSGFLTQYCGWHTYGNFNGANIKYSFVGDGGNNSGCSAQFGASPNGDPPVDAMVSVIAHELEESISDPNLNAWYDASGNENADKCAWNFGATYSAVGGGVANMKLGARDYLIQQNWLNANGGGCALSYATGTPDFSLAVSPSSQTLPSTGGTTGNYTITATPTNGFGASIAYSISGLPAGATASAIAGGVFTVTAAGTASGNYPFTITGVGGGLTHTAAATLVVSAPAQPTFTIGISPAAATVSRPGVAIYTVTITGQNGFNSTVTLNASGAKTGLALSLSSASVTGNGTSELTATVSSGAKRGSNTLTVTGTSGSIVKSASASLRIQ